MNHLLTIRDFEPFDTSHFMALGVTGLVGYGLYKLMKSGVDEGVRRWMRWVMAVILIISVIADPILSWLRYGDDPVFGRMMILENSLPLYLCDVVAIILAIALLFKHQRMAEVGYLWGIAGTVQGLITPTLYFTWKSPEFYAFFAQHGGAPIAAVMLVWGMGLEPERGVFKRAVLWSWIYLGVVYGLNVIFKTNYGFVNGKPAVPTLFDYMGPWPFYLITLQVIMFSLYALLLIPFGRECRSEVEG